MYFNCLYCPMQCFCGQYHQDQFYRQMPSNTVSASGIPMGPPPPFTPNKAQAMYENWQAGPGAFMIIDPSVIRTHLLSYSYIWLRNGAEFWTWLNRVEGNSTSGFFWNGLQWAPLSINISEIVGIVRY